jgi:hypothetical protein
MNTLIKIGILSYLSIHSILAFEPNDSTQTYDLWSQVLFDGSDRADNGLDSFFLPSKPLSPASEEESSLAQTGAISNTSDEIAKSYIAMTTTTQHLNAQASSFTDFAANQAAILKTFETLSPGLHNLDPSPEKEQLRWAAIRLIQLQLDAIKTFTKTSIHLYKTVRFDLLTDCLVNLFGTFQRCFYLWNESFDNYNEVTSFSAQFEHYAKSVNALTM